VYNGKDVVVNATKQKLVVMNAVEGTSIYIGNGCLLSNNIELHTSDYHSILDIKSTTRINSAKNIHLGDRVWIGLRSIILKGTNLPNNDTIVGAGSIVTGHFNNTNTVITGNPAKIIKSGVIWTHKKSNHRINYIIKVTSWEHF
jgi:O-acetyl transferase